LSFKAENGASVYFSHLSLSEELNDIIAELRELPKCCTRIPSFSSNQTLFSNREAIKALERALELDPNYAPAWAEAFGFFSGTAGLNLHHPRSTQNLKKALSRSSFLTAVIGAVFQVSRYRPKSSTAFPRISTGPKHFFISASISLY
jgi:hypothetical protein